MAEVEAAAASNAVNGEASCSSETPEKSTNEKVNELALSLLAQGRRHLLVSDIPAAITALAESCRLLGELYGDFADECAESYYYYGVALLEMARTDADVLGDAVEGGEKEGGSDSDEDDEEDGDAEGDETINGEPTDSEKTVADKADETKPETVKAEVGGPSQASEDKDEKAKPETVEAESKCDAHESSADVEMKESTPAVATTNGDSAASKTEDDATESKENVKLKGEGKGKSLKPVATTSEAKAETGDDGEDITEDVSNLQLAWEMFELAKKIYQRKIEADPTVKPKLADALIRLAEVAIESENYASAIEDLKKCLEIQHASFAPDSRSLAETYYQLGVAYTFTTEFQEAIKNFESAAKVIELRIENLKNPKERSLSIEDPKPFFHTIEGELEELEALLPDIKEKIADTIDLEKEAARKIAENGVNGSGPSCSKENGNSLMNDEPSTTNGKSPSSSSKPATDISHLIRKKRKPEEQEAEASAAKKVCSELPAADATTA